MEPLNDVAILAKILLLVVSNTLIQYLVFNYGRKKMCSACFPVLSSFKQTKFNLTSAEQVVQWPRAKTFYNCNYFRVLVS